MNKAFCFFGTIDVKIRLNPVKSGSVQSKMLSGEEERMTSKERVLTAFAHKEPDKVPVDFGGMCTSMVNCQVVAQLRDYYGLEKKLPRINDMSTMTAFVDPDL